MTDVTKKLLTDYDLMIAGKPHNIVEVEMYLHSAEHPDPYVHGYSEQELPNVFYFHRMGASYRGGTYKGLDVCFGRGKDSGTFHGVLIRSILTPEGELISGPCCCVDYILRTTGTESVADFVNEKLGKNIGVFQAETPLYLALKSKPLTVVVIETPRIGLWLPKNPKEHVDYVGKRYRFVRSDALRKAGWKGQPHTLVGAALAHLSNIKTVTGAKQTAIDLVTGLVAEPLKDRATVIETWAGKKALTGEDLYKFLVDICVLNSV